MVELDDRISGKVQWISYDKYTSYVEKDREKHKHDEERNERYKEHLNWISRDGT